jgi:hypothetical protein
LDDFDDSIGGHILELLYVAARPSNLDGFRHSIRAQSEPYQGFAGTCIPNRGGCLVVQIAAIREPHVDDGAESLTIRTPSLQPDRQPMPFAARYVVEQLRRTVHHGDDRVDPAVIVEIGERYARCMAAL